MRKYLLSKIIQLAALAVFLVGIAQTGLYAQSIGGGLLYTSYLPFSSAYNTLIVQNSVTNTTSTTQGFKFDKNYVIHYAPGIAFSGAFARAGLLTTVDIGLMGGPGADNIIPNFTLRPFIAASAGYKFTPVGLPIGFYGIGGVYFDFALGTGKNNYDFTHFLGFLRLGPGISLKLAAFEVFAQVQIGIGLQAETISLESKAGNQLYNGMFLMVPVALFPEIGIRLWS